MDACGDCGSVLASFGFPPTHSAVMLADILQFVTSKLEQANGQRIVLAVVCGPQEGIGGYLLHGTGVTTCTYSVAMEAVARGIVDAVQSMQLVVSASASAAQMRADELADDSSLLDEVPRSPRT